jgi:Mn-containing catalase
MMFLCVDTLQAELLSKAPRPNAGGALHTLIGGTYGEMFTLAVSKFQVRDDA